MDTGDGVLFVLFGGGLELVEGPKYVPSLTIVHGLEATFSKNLLDYFQTDLDDLTYF